MAQAAVYDAANQRRRGMIAKVKLAQKQLGLVEDDYRGMLLRETGNMSAADCTEAQLARMLDAMKRAGFRPTPPKHGRGTSGADHGPARKARALWISLHQLGVIRNASEMALEAFARRQLKVDALAWANQAQVYKLIEALKAMAERAGWSQSIEGVPPTQVIRVLKLRLCECLFERLKAATIVPEDMRLKQAAWTLCGLDDERGVGPMLWSAEQLDLLAKGLAGKLRHSMTAVSAAELMA